MVLRKYDHEFGLVLVCAPAYFGRQREMRLIPSPVDPPCHIYIVSQHPRISLLPGSAAISETAFSAAIRVQRGGEFELFDVEFPLQAGQTHLEVESDWPHEEIRLRDSRTQEVHTEAPLLLFLRTYGKGIDLPAISDQEIVYVGQSFGRDGLRTAFDRIGRHETLQRIYSEQQRDQEIWLTMCSISDVATVQTVGNIPVQVADEEANLGHATKVLKWIYSSEFRTKEAVGLIEAGLIRHFRPRYNQIFRNNFPDPRHVNVADCYDLEINSLIIELHGHLIATRFWTKESPVPRDTQFIQFPLFSEDDRRSMFELWQSDSSS